jgi:hypothetical protein
MALLVPAAAAFPQITSTHRPGTLPRIRLSYMASQQSITFFLTFLHFRADNDHALPDTPQYAHLRFVGLLVFIRVTMKSHRQSG